MQICQKNLKSCVGPGTRYGWKPFCVLSLVLSALLGNFWATFLTTQKTVMRISPVYDLEHSSPVRQRHASVRASPPVLPREWHCPSWARPFSPGRENSCIVILHVLLHLLPGDPGIADKKKKKSCCLDWLLYSGLAVQGFKTSLLKWVLCSICPVF